MGEGKHRQPEGRTIAPVGPDSAICWIDGSGGTLCYRGYDIQDLAAHCCFEEVAHLLWHGQLPDAQSLRETQAALARFRALSLPTVELLHSFPPDAPPMAVLRTALSALEVLAPVRDLRGDELALCHLITAQTASIITTWQAVRHGEMPVATDESLGHAGSLLYGLHGRYPDPLETAALDQCLTLHAEHGHTASTFAARVVAGTLSDLLSAVVAALGALRGPLHGGANQQVVTMLKEIGRPERVRPWVQRQLEQKRRILGFGHRVYQVEDPRATVLRQWCLKLGEHVGENWWYEVSQALEETVLAETGLHPNVDLYSASVYHMLGIPTDLFTCVFAAARVVGWTAHVREQWRQETPIRPRDHYVGPRGLRVTPMAERASPRGNG